VSATATATRVFGLGRAVYGTSLIVKPAVFARPWIGREAERPTVELAVRALGVRDAALGLGSLLTAGDSLSQRPWLAAGAISDLVDMGATIAAGRSIPERSRQGVAIFAAMSSLAGAVLYASRQKEAAH
jgi:hypothetical protein